MTDDAFVDAAEALAGIGQGNESQLAAVLLHFLPVDGAAVSTLGNMLGSETVSATDSLAARLDEVQFDLGEGPCWDALASNHPILESDFPSHAENVWPNFADEMSRYRVGAIFAFPLTLGPLEIGAIDLYTTDSSTLSQAQIAHTSMAATLISRVVLRRALRFANDDTNGTEHSRRIVHQATGMTIAQLRISPDDAMLLIQGHAFATGRSMMEVAGKIVEGRLRFSAGRNGIEDHQ